MTVTATAEAAWIGGRYIHRGTGEREATMTTGAELWREQGSRRVEEEEGVATRCREDGTGTGNFWVRHGER
jgi:hypothetical protein